MWSYSLLTKNYSKLATTNIASSGGLRFLILSVIASLTIPVVALSAYGSLSPTAQQITDFINDEKIPPALNESLSDTTSAATIETSIQTSTTTAGPSVDTKLKVNNQTIDVPANGSVSKTLSDEESTTKIDISVNSESTESSETNSSMNIQLNTTTEAVSRSGSGPE